jgi:hypothetical protein
MVSPDKQLEKVRNRNMKKSFKIALGAAAVFGIACLTVWAYSVDAVTSTASFPSGLNVTVNPHGNSVTINDPLCPDDVVPFSVTYSLTDNAGNSTVPQTLSFGFTTTARPVGASDVLSTGFNTTHSVNVGFSATDSGSMTAPSTPGAYTVHVGTSGSQGQGGISGAQIVINFTVVACPTPPSCNPVTPNLDVTSPVCMTLHDPNPVTLTATLTDPNTHAALSGKTIVFKVDGNTFAGNSAMTNGSGVATVSYDASSLAVGDHEVTASWTSDDTCNYNDASGAGTLGVTYLFIGFQQPINFDGSSIFKGGTVPVKIKLSDYNGAAVTDAVAHVFFQFGTPAVIGDASEAVSTSAATTGNLMRYDPVADQYIFNWDITAASIANGTYTIWIDLGEGTCGAQHTAVVSIQKTGRGIRR